MPTVRRRRPARPERVVDLRELRPRLWQHAPPGRSATTLHRMSSPQHPSAPEPATRGPREPQITETECEQCGTRVAGLDGRYACGVCGAVNAWSEGYQALPSAEDDLDYPGPGKTEARRSS